MCYLDGMKEFSKESYVFQNIYNNTKKNLLCEYISNSKVALVGNAPHVDNGGYRKKIDSYPTVIRMNSYNLSEDYIKKFGSKTTIWYRWNGEKKEEKDLNKGNPKLSFLGCSPYTFLYESYLVDRYKDELNHGHIITAIKPQEHQEICKNLDMLYPSGGLILIYLIKKYNSKFSADDCYGFSFKQDNCSEWKHFNNYTEKMPVHNLLLEKEKICTLLKNK